MKKLLSLLLAVILCVSVGLSAVAEEAAKETRTYDFVFIVKSMQFSFMLSMIDGANAAAGLVDNINIVCEGRRRRTASASKLSWWNRPSPTAWTRL